MTIQYQVSMDTPQTHYFEVEMLVPKDNSEGRDKLRVIMPVWTPGSYVVREFARNVIDFRAQDADSEKELKSFKDSKNSWVIELPSNLSVKITYRVYALEYTVDTSYLDSRHGIINGASVFMFAEGRESEPIRLKVIPYSEWKVIATSLEETEPRVYSAENYDILVDSPLEIGNQEIRNFEVEGKPHQVSMFGPKPVDSESFVSDLKKIVESTWKVFGVIPYSRYVFIVDFGQGGRGGGLEHLSSTHCIAPRLMLIPKQEYNRMMGLFSHEFFHAWNVKRMRPKGLGPFNYSSETYTKSLWIAEGITSYYDDLILRRAQIYSVPEYLDAHCANIDVLRFFPAPAYQSAEESSFDTWIKFYRQNENSPNVVSSYYNQGAVIGWMIDMAIRRATSSSKSLDDAMRRLYNETYAKENRGYLDEEFERICVELGGQSISKEIFDTRVRSKQKVDFDRYLGYAGLKLGTKAKTKSEKKGYLGMKLKSEAGKVSIASRLFSTPAEQAGLAAGDEILAVDNLRVDASTLPFYIGNKKPNDKVSILISRDGYLETVEAILAELPEMESRIYKKEEANPEEKSLFKHWLLQDWDLPVEYTEEATSPLRTKVLDYF